MDNKAQVQENTWFGLLEKLRATLSEGHAIASEIAGAEVEERNNDNRKASCYIERLNDELAQALCSAEYLVSRLRNISQQF